MARISALVKRGVDSQLKTIKSFMQPCSIGNAILMVKGDDGDNVIELTTSSLRHLHRSEKLSLQDLLQIDFCCTKTAYNITQHLAFKQVLPQNSPFTFIIVVITSTILAFSLERESSTEYIIKKGRFSRRIVAVFHTNVNMTTCFYD